MIEKARRKELRAHYREVHPLEAGVYRIVNRTNGKALIGSTPNLAAIRSKMEFARSTNMSGVLDLRLRDDVRHHGIDAFSLEILEVLDRERELTAEESKRDLATLEALWRERFDAALLY